MHSLCVVLKQPVLDLFLLESPMEDKTGWISLHRKIQDNKLWREPRVFSKAEAWIDILMEVQHGEKQSSIMIKNTTITCDRGQSIKSIQTWAERWTWRISKTRRFLHLLKREKMVVIENLRKTTRLSVCNYSTYQQKRISHESHMNLKRISHESHMNTDNKVNNENNENNGKDLKQPLDFTRASSFDFKKLFSDTFKPENRYEINTLNKLAKDYAEKHKGLKHAGRYMIDKIADLKEMCKIQGKSRTDFIKIFVSQIKKELK